MPRISRVVLTLALAIVFGLTAVPTAEADDFSFIGNFSQNDGVALFGFTVTTPTPSLVTLRTWSYAGGVNAAGQTIARGGFDPYLSLFFISGTLSASGFDEGEILAVADDGPPGVVPIDPVSGAAFDAFARFNLPSGTYVLSLTQFPNRPVVFSDPTRFLLSDGFQRDGQGNYLGGFPDSEGRSSQWAVDILNVAQAEPIPEPATLLLLGTGLAGVAARSYRRRARSKW